MSRAGEPPVAPPVRRRTLHVEGIVQGVGYRPFVHALASELQLAGQVANDPTGVVIQAEGAPQALDSLARRLRDDAPVLAVVDAVTVLTDGPATGERSFTILPSDRAGGRSTLVSPDAATCPDCLREVHDPGDRRRGHPMVNCTNCGPRYSIIRDVPYDRPATTMATFEPCPRCAAEYADPADRRFHAQPVCCPDCGPRVRLTGSALVDTEAVAEAGRRLREGAVLAIKGVGGFHLAALASAEPSVARLRAAKHRVEKPFAVMARDLAQARRLVDIDPAAADLLASSPRPIVLLPRRPAADVAASVAPGNRRLGVLLAYTALHDLLLEAVGAPIVLTSGNVSDEPIAHRDDDAARRLGGMVDATLTHDRPIHVRVDDSVATVIDGAPTILRRSRGYVPTPFMVEPFPRHVLAVGAQLKNTVCLGRDRHAFVSQHIGDLEHYETLTAFGATIDHLQRLFGVVPEVVAHDLHPEYLSTKHALDLPLERIGVQHHHAHIASCLADNRHAGPVIGVAFDGTGYGTDGSLWGGEILAADLVDSHRLGHLAEVALPGGEAAIRHPWRMAASHLAAAGVDAPAAFVARHQRDWAAVQAVIQRPGLSPVTSSIGRLFDAAAALLGVRDEVTYEAQAAIELEQLAETGDHGSLTSTVVPGEPFTLQAAPLIRDLVEAIAAGQPPARIAARFHAAVADLVVMGCRLARDSTGLTTVALSGGVFQNATLLSPARRRLTAEGFEVLTHHRVPPNDGGISLGQAVIVGARDRQR